MRPRPILRRRTSTAAGVAVLVSLLAATLFTATAADAQIGRLRDAAGRLGAQAVNPSRLLEGEPPITTSLGDARFAVDSLDGFRPHDISNYRSRGGTIHGIPVASIPDTPTRSMLELERTPSGGFVLRAGSWEMHAQSYCLKAGTHGPGGGDGYLYAPTEGPAAEHVLAILHGSVTHPEIPQSEIQTLLWAIIARAKFEDLSTRHKTVAQQLLTPRQLATLNRNALDLLPGPALSAALAEMPPLVRQAFEAEASLRRMLSDPASTFEQLERTAVLAGLAPVGAGSREVAEGRWSRHPDGYYVRYLPRGYSHTLVQLWVPEGSDAIGRQFDPATHVAVPGNTARQRLVQSGRTRPAG
jgi:hypothetical protein